VGRHAPAFQIKWSIGAFCTDTLLVQVPVNRYPWLAMAEDKAMWVKIRLRPETASTIMQCMDTGAFSPMSDFLESVLVVFHEHSQTLLDYIEQEEAKGFTHEEIFGMLNSDITFCRLDN
jgi:hypothetical protein